MNWPIISDQQRIRMLQLPENFPVDVVLDTDAFNEIDDQFCICYTALCPQFNVKAMYAAPYTHDYLPNPADGMQKSYEEILKLLTSVGRRDIPVYKGSAEYMTEPFRPVESPAARDIISRARSYSPERPLYVMAIGCPVNVSSALIMAPDIIDKIVVIWLGGNAMWWPTAQEYNLMQDVYASRILFDSGVPLMLLPCAGVVDHLATTLPELDSWLKGSGELGDYLCGIVKQHIIENGGLTPYSSKVIWDISVPALLTLKGAVKTTLVHTPHLSEDMHWAADETRPLMRAAYSLERDMIFEDVIEKINKVQRMGGVRIGLSVDAKPGNYYDGWFEEMKRAGIYDVEASGVFEEMTGEDMRENCRRLKSMGFNIWSMHLPFGSMWDISSPDEEVRSGAVEKMMDFLDVAADYEIKYCVVHPSWEPIDPQDRPSHKAAFKRSLSHLCSEAGSRGLIIAVEDLPRTCLCNSTAEMAELLEGSSAGICFDTNHILGEPAHTLTDQLADRVVTLHISDYDYSNEKHWLPGEGDADFGRIFASLKTAGYSGVYIMELAKHRDGSAYTPTQAAQALKKVLEEVE